MVQIEDEIYTKLKKDADDNRQIVRIAKIIAITIMFLIIFFTWGLRLIDLDIQKRTIEMQNQMMISQAKTNQQVMSIESEGMTKDEYFEWLTVRND